MTVYGRTRAATCMCSDHQPAWDGAWSPPARFPAVVLPMLSGYIALALQRVPSLIVRGFAVTATVYAGTLITLAIFTSDGGFTTGAAARPGLPPMFAAWTAATIGIAASVGLLSWREQTRKSQGSSTLVFRSFAAAGRRSVGDTPGTGGSWILECEEESIDGSATILVRVIRRCLPAPPHRARWPVSLPCSGRALPRQHSILSSGWWLV
jgi:hypothetical protein